MHHGVGSMYKPLDDALLAPRGAARLETGYGLATGASELLHCWRWIVQQSAQTLLLEVVRPRHACDVVQSV